MRIWLLNQFYPPDAAPTGVMLAGVAGQLAADGHEVVVWCSGGAYGGEEQGRLSRRMTNDECRMTDAVVGGPLTVVGEEHEACGMRHAMEENAHAASGMRHAERQEAAKAGGQGVEVRRVGRAGAGKRLAAKFVGWSGFYLGLAWRLVRGRPRPDLIVAMTTPPFLSVLARVAGWWHGARVAHWVMDLYPDALAAHGMVKEHSLAMAVLRWLARFGFGGRGNGPIVVLGPCMAGRVAALVGKELDVRWVPLWAGEGGETKAES